MPHTFDASTKFLTEGDRLADWLALTGRKSRARVEPLPTDLATVSAVADKVALVHERPPWIWPLELQASRDPLLARRLNVYNALLESRHNLPVLSTVVLLRPKADDAALTGVYECSLPGESPYRRFAYQVVRMWELPPEVLFRAGIGLIPLVPLCNVDVEQLPGLIDRMQGYLRESCPLPTQQAL